MIDPADMTFMGVPVGHMSREQLIEFIVWLVQGRVEQFERLGVNCDQFAKDLREPDFSVFREEL